MKNDCAVHVILLILGALLSFNAYILWTKNANVMRTTTAAQAAETIAWLDTN